MDQYRLFQYRWDISLLAEMFRSNGAKLITLQQRCGISRGVLKSSLARLIAAGLVCENPGYGHPLRPEYILTANGQAIGPFCVEFLLEGQKRQIEEVMAGRWSAPTIIRTGPGAQRFNELKKQLDPVTSRALSSVLKSLQEHSCLITERLDTSPPANIYSLGKKSRGLYRIYQEHQTIIDAQELL